MGQLSIENSITIIAHLLKFWYNVLTKLLVHKPASKMILSKSRIRLSRTLRAQITPHPQAAKWLKRSLFLAPLLLVIVIYLAASPHKKAEKTQPREGLPALERQVLGETNNQDQIQYLFYRVKKGDTLFNLSQKYGISWQTLAELNHLKEPYLLKIGQEIKIPQKR